MSRDLQLLRDRQIILQGERDRLLLAGRPKKAEEKWRELNKVAHDILKAELGRA